MDSNGIDDSNVEEYSDYAFISIVNSDEVDRRYFKDIHRNVLNLTFDDVTETENLSRIGKGLTELKLFTSYDARKIIDFLNINAFNSNTLFIHCAAGTSRSGAVGVFANDNYGSEDYFKFKKQNNRIIPNYYVLRILTEESLK